jgi:pimeloyl-ACP methyl ester carboxylesterase
MSAQVEEVRLSLGHIELAAHLFGPEDGLPVIALHGWLDNANSFARLAPQLKGLRIVALDLAGHGIRSIARWAPVMPWDYARCAAGGRATGLAAFRLLGHSLGAIISVQLAGALPERVSHLALIDGVIPRPAPSRMPPSAWAWPCRRSCAWMASASRSTRPWRGVRRA